MSLREIVNIEQVKERSNSFLGDNDGSCTLMLQTLEDGHPTYLVIASQFELVILFSFIYLPFHIDFLFNFIFYILDILGILGILVVSLQLSLATQPRLS